MIRRARPSLPWWSPLLVAALLMLWGYLRLVPSASMAAESSYPAAATARLAWSDIISIYGRADLAGHPLPYIHGHSLEYPVLTGVVFYLVGWAGYGADVTTVFTITYLLLAVSGLALLWLIIREPGSNPWLFALSPALVLYTGANWDMLALMPGVAALLLYRRDRDLPATVLLALSVWLKFFALLWLPLVLIDRARRRMWASCARIVALFAALSVLINLPFALRDSYEWGLFFSFNQERAIEVNFWTIIRDWRLSVDTVNNLTALGVGLMVLALCSVQWQRREDLTIPGAALLITWFFVLNKVYSPQYFLWLIPFLALLSAPVSLAVALAFVDVLYYLASFQILRIGILLGPAEQQYRVGAWDFDHVLMPAMELRELAFLALIVWLGWRLWLGRLPLPAE